MNSEANKEVSYKYGYVGIFIPAALIMFLLTRYLIPFLTNLTGQETILFWFIIGGVGIFAPLILTGLFLLRKEGSPLTRETFINRLRFRKPNTKELLLSLAGLIIAGLASALIMKMVESFSGTFDHSPPFMSFEPLSKGRYWLLGVWLPYWKLNIFGEEFLWRGVLLPVQEKAFGRYAWVIHGTGWGLFHIAFGWQLLLTLLPLLYLQSFLVQKTKNSWTGVIMHGGLNGPAFLAICFGLI
jgi:membrane protease YdiL (CAAX protease family)